MNDLYERARNKTLIITEGNHEKFKLLKLIFLAFPEINIPEENIVIYESNIYNLYNKVIDEYGDDWKEQDVDLPKCVAKWKSLDYQLTKHDFTNVILIFDYERHDPNFSETIINEFQEYFCDMNDNGLLFINYPMVEAYMNIDINNFDDYENYCINSNIKKGVEYKSIVKNTEAYKAFSVLSKLSDNINEFIKDSVKAEEIAKQVLELSYSEELRQQMYSVFKTVLEEDIANTMSYRYLSVLKRFNCIEIGENYFDFIRKLFNKIIICNIKKAYKLQSDTFNIGTNLIKDIYFDELNLIDVLSKQNEASRDITTGIIWILNTSIFIVANYKFFWKRIL